MLMLFLQFFYNDGLISNKTSFNVTRAVIVDKKII